MNRLANIFCLVTSLFCFTALAADAVEEKVDEEMVARAIAFYKQDPLSQNGMAAGSLVLKFAEQSPYVEITLSEKILSWLVEENKPAYADELLVAYLVGNVQSQISRQKTLDNPHAGILMVLKIYELIRQKDKNFSIKSIEQFKNLQLEGKLRQHLFAKLGKKRPEVTEKNISLVSRVNYPKEVGDYAFVGIHDYEKPELGISMRYKRKGSEDDYFDIYVYPVSDDELEKQMNDAVLKEYGVAKSGIYYAVKRGIYQQVDPQKETMFSTGANIYPVAQGIYKLLRDNKALFTILYVTISNEYYVKLRATYPDNKLKLESGHLQREFSQSLSGIHVQ